MSQAHKVLLASLLLEANGVFAQISENAPISVSLIQLIATPEKFHGKSIRVVGFVHIEFESSGIFLNIDDYKYRSTRNALEIGVPQWALKNTKKINNRYAIVEGVFDSKNPGHMGLFSGSIREITRISPMPPPAP